MGDKSVALFAQTLFSKIKLNISLLYAPPKSVLVECIRAKPNLFQNSVEEGGSWETVSHGVVTSKSFLTAVHN